jgi:eukaryotic-like serine/threonine-protein kinase
VIAAALIVWLTSLPHHPHSSARSSSPATSEQARPAAQQSPIPTTSSTGSALAAPPPSSSALALAPAPGGSPSAPANNSPAAIVQSYFAAINAHDYAQAWQLGGDISSSSYASFVAGFDTTARDTVTVISVSGDEVTAQLAATQTDGTVKDFSGVYTTGNGVIVQAQVQQTN